MTNNNQHIPSGYKPSPLGIIPEDWEVKKIGEFGKVITGNTPPTENADNYGNAYKFVSPADISDSKYIEVTEKHLSKKGFSISRHMPKGTVLFTCIGSTIGKCAIANESLTSNQQINAIICDSKHSGEFLYYELSHRSNRIKLIAGEQAVPIINKSTFENYKVLCPPFEEQKDIADLLSLWDTAISKQSALIEKLTQRKRGLMQQLLTGKKRLKGFSGEWKRIKLGDVADVIGGGTPNTENANYWDGDILWFTPSEIGKTKYVSQSARKISKEGLVNSSAKKLPQNTILFTSRATIGAKAILTIEATTNQGFQSLVVNNNNSFEFIYYYLDIILNTIKQKASGSTFPEVSADSLRKIIITIPSIEEQNAIATVLVNVDNEIEIAKEKLLHLQNQKRGLMQVLLTGKRRVK
ncbi:MAG: restriction endonuclease subunit S [Bacteroidales bacterium]|nr:restriction endonuclease subunit S [Bacteroidales bacterium]